MINGGMQLQEMLEQLGIENEAWDADTVGGWVGEMLQKVPEEGDRFDAGGYRFEAAEMDGFRVTKVRAEKTPDPEEAPEEQNAETPEQE